MFSDEEAHQEKERIRKETQRVTQSENPENPNEKV